jgi:hypothetical protein
VNRRPLVLAALLAAALALPRCDLPQEPLAGNDVPLADAAATDATPARDVTGAPVPCTALGGDWLVSLCGSYAVPVTFVASGCEALLLSPLVPEVDAGSARLEQPNRLTLVLPGGSIGALSCETRMTTSSFAGTCVNAVNRCDITGVRAR